MMMRYYFDTSAINKLHDCENSKLIQSIINESPVRKTVKCYISVFTLAELLSESNAKRRKSLIQYAKSIVGSAIPAANAGDLLKRALIAMDRREIRIENSINGDEYEGLLQAYFNPELIDNEASKEAREWKDNQEKWFQEHLNNFRPTLQHFLNKLVPREKRKLLHNFSNFIKPFMECKSAIKSFIRDYASKLKNVPTNDKFIDFVLINSEHWRFFLAGLGYAAYARAAKQMNYSAHKNPGSIDTQQAIYYAISDIFVTGDKDQYKMLRYIKVFGHKNKYAWTWKRFYKWVVAQSSSA